jgi:ribosomal protein S18 acetylase RimI-like enzyme
LWSNEQIFLARTSNGAGFFYGTLIMIRIRRTTLEDATLMSRLAAETMWQSHGHSAPAFEVESFISAAYNVDQIAEELADNQFEHYLVFVDDEPAGFCKFQFHSPHPLIPEQELTKLNRIYVLDKFHGQKAGATLFDLIIARSKEEKQQGIWLNTWIENKRAIAFYQKKGFEIIGHADFALSPTHVNPNYVMYLNLNIAN